MAISERLLNHETLAKSPDTRWFTVRQPGIVRFLDDRLQGDALALGLAGACQICLAFQGHRGAPCPSLSSAVLEWAEEDVLARTLVSTAGERTGGLAERQPALLAWIASFVETPPALLGRDERRDVGMAMLAVAHALDHAYRHAERHAYRLAYRHANSSPAATTLIRRSDRVSAR